MVKGPFSLFRRFPPAGVWCLAAAAVFSCGERLTAPVNDNPYDPANPAFRAPAVTITRAPAVATTLTVDTCTIAWAGNSRAVDYSYRLEPGSWSDWTADTAVIIRNLLEGENTVYVKTRDRAGNQSIAASARFAVDMITGPALLVQPGNTTVQPGAEFHLIVYADEMPDSCVLADLHLEYDRSRLELVSIDRSDFFGQNNGNILFTQSDTMDTITILTGVAGGTPAWVGGSGNLAVITLKAKPAAGTAEVRFSATRPSVLQKSSTDLDYGQHTINLTQKRSAVITIQ